MSNVYEGQFSDWDDVRVQFEMDAPEPDEVLLAQYEYECYEGSAIVIYRIGDRFYINFGGHCSCYGLEGQWDPEEYSAEEFLAAYQRGNWYRDIPNEVMRRVRETVKDNYHGA